VHMDIVGGMALQRLDRGAFACGIGNLDPQQEATLIQVLLQVFGVLGFKQAAQIGPDLPPPPPAMAAAATARASVPPEATTKPVAAIAPI